MSWRLNMIWVVAVSVVHQAYRFALDLQRAQRPPANVAAVVGVDIGINHLAVLSTGEMIDNPQHLKTALRKLRRTSRAVSRKRGPDRRIGREPSRRWVKANQARNKVHHRVAHLRCDGLHKLTNRLVRDHGTVVVEDLNVVGMLRNRRLARSIADAGFGEIRRQLSYKTLWVDGRLHTADRWYPSSKTCSDCGATKAKLPLRVRTFTCQACGLVIDRDLNAARNLAALAADVAQSCGETQNARRGAVRPSSDAGHVLMKREPHKQGTLPPQGASYLDHALIRAHSR